MPNTPKTDASTLTIPVEARPFLAASRIAELVTCRQMALLHVVAANPGRSVGVLAQHLGTHKPAVTRACDMLVKHGLVDRLVDAEDRRKNSIRITAQGTLLLSQQSAAA